MKFRPILLTFAFFALFTAAYGQERPAVRVVYFSDEYKIGSNLQNAFQDALLKGNTLYTIDRVEKLPTLFNGNSYILNMPADLDENLLQDSNVYYKSIGKKEAVITSSSLMVQNPSFDKKIKNALLKSTQDDSSAKNFVAADTIYAKTGLLTLKNGGTLDVLSTDFGNLKASWVPAVLVNYYLNKGLDESTISIFEKPLGGIGAWYDAVKDISKKETVKPVIIDTGGIAEYRDVNPGAQFFADYWKEMNIDVLSVSPKDLELMLEIQSQAKDIPPLLASNIEPDTDGAQNPFTKTQIIERNGIKIGVFSLVQPMPLHTSDGKYMPYTVSDPAAAAAAAVSALRSQGKADFIIMVSHMDDVMLNRVFKTVYGIDMVITAQNADSASSRRRRVELQNWNREKHFLPAYVSANNGYVLGDTAVTFEKNTSGLSPSVIEDNQPRDLYFGNTFSNRFYAINKKLFSGITKQGDELLPEAKKVSYYGQSPTLSYSPFELFGLSAAIIKKKTGAEAAFIKILPFNEQFLGNINESEIKKLLGADTPIVTAKIRGDKLKKMLDMSDLGDAFSGGQKDYFLSSSLAVSGIIKDGDDYKINGLKMNDDEYYYTAFPASLLQERFMPQEVKEGIVMTKGPDLKLHETVINYLRTIKDQNERAAAALFDAYLQEYNFRQENNIPPQTETEELLDQKMQDIGPQAVAEYFTQQNSDNYYKEIFDLMNGDRRIYGQWRFNLKKVSLQATSTQVSNAGYYQNFSNSRLTSDSQKFIQGSFIAAEEYYKDRVRWNNNLDMEYGRISLHSYDGMRSSNESVDKISLASDYTYKFTDVKDILGGFSLGPFLSLGYDTEFTRNDGAPRYKAMQGKGGLRLFEGQYIKNLYLAVVPEIDFTYPTPANKYAWEFGVNAEHKINDDTKAVYGAMIRDFFIADNKNGTDYRYELQLDASLQTEIWSNLSVAPFISYYRAKAVSFDEVGSNLYIGVSFSYSRIFKRLPF